LPVHPELIRHIVPIRVQHQEPPAIALSTSRKSLFLPSGYLIKKKSFFLIFSWSSASLKVIIFVLPYLSSPFLVHNLCGAC